MRRSHAARRAWSPARASSPRYIASAGSVATRPTASVSTGTMSSARVLYVSSWSCCICATVTPPVAVGRVSSRSMRAARVPGSNHTP